MLTSPFLSVHQTVHTVVDMGVFIALAVLSVLGVSEVTSYCFTSSAGLSASGELPTGCVYEGWMFGSGSEFKTPSPRCMNCTCSGITLSCCSYGVRVSSHGFPPGCKKINNPGSCIDRVVLEDDESQPCPDVGYVGRK